MLVPSIIAVAALAAAGIATLVVRSRRAGAVDEAAARAQFEHQLRDTGAPVDLLGHTFDALHARLPDGRVDVRPDDSLADVYGLTRLDLEDVALVIVARSGGRTATGADLDALRATVVTVRDLVRFLAPFCAPV